MCLKICLKLKLEMAKIRYADHLWKEKDPSFYSLRMVDMRDLVRVSSSVAVVEDVLNDLNSIDKDQTVKCSRIFSFFGTRSVAGIKSDSINCRGAFSAPLYSG